MKENLSQRWPLPSKPRPIVIIGAGGIVSDAHLPAYEQAGFTVTGIFDLNKEQAEKTAEQWNIPTVYSTLEEATQSSDVVYDLALPPIAVPATLEVLPDNVPVLIQKPMGLNLEEARTTKQICHRKNFVAAVNFQLRYAPMMLALRDAVQKDISVSCWTLNSTSISALPGRCFRTLSLWIGSNCLFTLSTILISFARLQANPQVYFAEAWQTHAAKTLSKPGPVSYLTTLTRYAV